MVGNKDKMVLVVGSATGMGNATVKMLLEEGAKVIAFDVSEDNIDDDNQYLTGAQITVDGDWTASC